jgi:hypothetical protein
MPELPGMSGELDFYLPVVRDCLRDAGPLIVKTIESGQFDSALFVFNQCGLNVRLSAADAKRLTKVVKAARQSLIDQKTAVQRQAVLAFGSTVLNSDLLSLLAGVYLQKKFMLGAPLKDRERMMLEALEEGNQPVAREGGEVKDKKGIKAEFKNLKEAMRERSLTQSAEHNIALLPQSLGYQVGKSMSWGINSYARALSIGVILHMGEILNSTTQALNSVLITQSANDQIKVLDELHSHLRRALYIPVGAKKEATPSAQVLEAVQAGE